MPLQNETKRTKKRILCIRKKSIRSIRSIIMEKEYKKLDPAGTRLIRNVQ